MEKTISIIPNTLLKQHEKVQQTHLKELLSQIKADGFISDPVIVDKNTMIILDGHHRFNALRLLGLRFTPAYLVDYKRKEIKVTSWRKGGKKVTKNLVILAGLSGKLLRSKTSRHSIPDKPEGIRTPLIKLM